MRNHLTTQKPKFVEWVWTWTRRLERRRRREGDEEEEEEDEEEGDEEEGDKEEAEDGGGDDEVEPSEEEVVETAVRAALKAKLKSCKLPEDVATTLLASHSCNAGDVTFEDPFKLRCADVEATLAAGGAGAVVRMRYHSRARNYSYEFVFDVSWRPAGQITAAQKPWRLLARGFQREAPHTGDRRIDDAPQTYAVEVYEAAVPMAAELASQALRAAVFGGEASQEDVDDKALLRLVLASVGALRCEKPLGVRTGYSEWRKGMNWLSVAIRAAVGQPGERDAAFVVKADASANWRKADWGERVYERCEPDEEEEEGEEEELEEAVEIPYARVHKYVKPWHMRAPPEGLWDYVEREGRLPWAKQPAGAPSPSAMRVIDGFMSATALRGLGAAEKAAERARLEEGFARVEANCRRARAAEQDEEEKWTGE